MQEEIQQIERSLFFTQNGIKRKFTRLCFIVKGGYIIKLKLSIIPSQNVLC